MTVILLSAGCGTTSAPSPQATRATSVPVPAVHGAAPAPAAVAAPPVDLLALRSELYGTERNGTLASTARFRPLCDSEGYPLVGNIATKGPQYSVAEFCGDVRAAAATAATAKAGS